MSGMLYPIKPCTKPRQTQRDKWLDPPRAPVRRYRNFKDEVKLHCVMVAECNCHIIFHIETKKKELWGLPHQVTPDKDNLEKALLDAIFSNDAAIWDSRVSKRWAEAGAIEINVID
jgi:Holliday junction resolvase RusA-like endonuclease